MSSEVEIEPVPGLPEALPAGEHIVWQGRPRWRGLALHTFQVGWLALYFALFIVSRIAFALHEGGGLATALAYGATVLPLAAICLGLLSLLAWVNARASMYTITSRRVVMLLGVAFTMTFNLPFKRIGAARLIERRGGEGDIALELSGPGRIAWLHLWPHARPWRLAKAQPMLRSIPEAARVARQLGEAVAAWSIAEHASVVLGAEAPAGHAGSAVGLGGPLTAAEAGR